MSVPAQSVRLKIVKPPIPSVAAILPAKGTPQRRRFVLVTAALCLFGLPLLFSTYVWFGGAPDEQELALHLGEPVRVAQARQAIAQIAVRMSRGGRSMQHWYPRIRALAVFPDPDLRQSVAWAMGRDSSEASFREPLRKLLADPDVMVRRAAALSLANHGDAQSKAELEAMLRPYAVRAATAGPIRILVHPGDRVSPWSDIARTNNAAGDLTRIRAPVPGVVKSVAGEGEVQAEIGHTLIEIAPDSEQTTMAQKALRRLAAATSPSGS
jgi:hypothetical protein